MAKYGAKGIRFAPFAATDPEPANAFPNYGASISLGGLKTLTDAPENAEAETYEDNALGARKVSFKKCNVDVEVGEMLNATAAVVLGAEIDETTSNLELGDDDAPWGGLAFYYSTQDKAGNVKHKGVYYPKVQAAVQGSDYETTGENLSFKGDKLKFTGAKCNKGKWKVLSPETFTDEADAIAWVAAIVAAAV